MKIVIICILGLLIMVSCKLSFDWGYRTGYTKAVLEINKPLPADAIIEPSLPQGCYRVGNKVYNWKNEYVGIWIARIAFEDGTVFENCLFQENKEQ